MAMESAQGVFRALSGATRLSVDRARLTHLLLLRRNMATPYASREGKRAARGAHGRAGMGGGKKRRPSCNGVDRG
jgi:hypothetical protein